MINYIILMLLTAAVIAAVVLATDIGALRRLAAWALARALYLEFLRAERERLRNMTAAFMRERLAEYGVEPVE